MEPLRLAGMVLCGGQSRRMGAPKATLEIAGETLLARTVRLLGQAARPVVVVAGPDQVIPKLPADVLLARDAVAGRGPLQGILAGLLVLDGVADLAYVSGCDTPFLEPALVRRLVSLLGECDACVPCIAGKWHPLSAIYRLSVRPTIERLLVENCLKTTALLENVSTRPATAAELLDVDPELRTLRNLNTMEEFAACGLANASQTR